jgi:Leucine-rich repeat (LRR) protein
MKDVDKCYLRHSIADTDWRSIIKWILFIKLNCLLIVMIYYNKQMKVDLSNGHLDEIKNYKLKYIIELNLSGNKLKELPEWIDKCVNLQRLYCSHNQLALLPESLPNSLQILYCRNNQLTSLPESLSTNLQELYCSNNQLTSLPESLPNTLQKLDCSNNQLISLPERLPTTLQKLYCGNNQLTSLPESFPNSLQILDCWNNQLISLPISILNCRFLIAIYYDNNEIENIHPAIIRFLNRIKNRNMTVYNDRQSVHNGNVQASIRQSIINILLTRLD